MYLQKVTGRKNCVKKLVFCWHLEGQWIRIHKSEAWIRGSGSTLKCHGSGTLLSFMSLLDTSVAGPVLDLSGSSDKYSVYSLPVLYYLGIVFTSNRSWFL